MLIRKFRYAKNKKGLTLLEMIAAVLITSILAAVVSMMIVPVTNIYNQNEIRSVLAQAAEARLNDVAIQLRGAKGVYVSASAFSFPDINTTSSHTKRYKGVRMMEAKYGFAMASFKEGEINVTKDLYPVLKIADYRDESKPVYVYPPTYVFEGDEDEVDPFAKTALASDDYLKSDDDLRCPDKNCFYMLVRKNPDNNNVANVLEVHLKVKKNNVSYEAVKIIVCENLVMKSEPIYTADFSDWTDSKTLNLKTASVSKGDTITKYYSVWFSKRK